MAGITVELLRPHRLNRWILPLGFLGLGAIVAVLMALPSDAGKAFFWPARIVFVIAYLALLGVGMSRSRRTATVTADAAGLREGDTVLVARDAIERVLCSRAGAVTTIELRGKTPLWLELRSTDDADALLAALDPDRDAATATYLATTTPVYLMVLSWMGIPAAMSFAAQPLMEAHVDLAIAIAAATPGVILWIGATWWFGRRRKVSLSPTELAWPRLFGGRDEHIALIELTAVEIRDPFTLRIVFARRRARQMKIYDPALVEDFLVRVKQRAHISIVDRRKPT